MRDDSLIVAGELTGKWTIKCGYCGTLHRQTSSLKRCAERAAHVFLGNDVQFRLPEPPAVCPYTALKKGLYTELCDLQSTFECHTLFRMPIKVYAKAETRSEAAFLMVQELGKFVTSLSQSYEAYLNSVKELSARMLALPDLKLGQAKIVKIGYSSEVRVADEVLSSQEVFYYFADRASDEKQRTQLRKDENNWRIVFLDPDRDMSIFKNEYQSDSPMLGMRIADGVTSVIKSSSKESKIKAELETL